MTDKPDLRKVDLGEVFQSQDGKLWQVMAIYGEPSVMMVELTFTDGAAVRKQGCVSAEMWNGHRRLDLPYRTSWHPGVKP